MYELLEYLIAIGGSVVLFFITKSTNMGVRQFTLYCVCWSCGASFCMRRST